MSAEEGEVSDGQVHSDGGLESGEESDHDSAQNRRNYRGSHAGRGADEVRYHRMDRMDAGHARSDRWRRGYVRGGEPHRTHNRSHERSDRSGRHLSKKLSPGKPPVQHSRDRPGDVRDRGGGRERAGSQHRPSAPSKSKAAIRDGSSSLDEAATKQAASSPQPVHHADLIKMQKLITLDTVGVAAAKQSFSYTCAVLRKGLAIQQQVWSAERDRGQAAALYQDPEWEGMRTRLLSGLKAVHLVCTAGVVSDITSLKLGLSTLEEAREVSAALTNLRKPQQTSEVVSWCTSLASALSMKQKPRSPSPSAAASSRSTTPVSSRSASPRSTAGAAQPDCDGAANGMVKTGSGQDTAAPGDEDAVAEGMSRKQPDGSRERTGTKVSLAQSQEPESQACGFKPRVMFRLNISGTGAAAGNAASELVCAREPEAPLPAAQSPVSEPGAHVGAPGEPAPQPSREPSAVELAGAPVEGAQVPTEDASGDMHQTDTVVSKSQSPAPLPPEPEESPPVAASAEAKFTASALWPAAAGPRAPTAHPATPAAPVADIGGAPHVDAAVRVDAVAPAELAAPAVAVAPANSGSTPAAASVPESATAAAPAPPARSRKSRWDMRAEPPQLAEPSAAEAVPAAQHSERPRAAAPSAAAAMETGRATSSAAAAPPASDGGLEREYTNGRGRDPERDARRERDAERSRDRDREREPYRDRDRDRERDRDRLRDRDRERERGRQPVADAPHRGDSYGEPDRKRGRFDRDGPRRNRDKVPHLEEERQRGRSPEHAAGGADGRGGHGPGGRGSSAGANGSVHAASGGRGSLSPSVVRTPAACAPVRTSKPVGLIIEEEPVTPPSAAGLFTVPAARPVLVREESVTPVAASLPAERPAAQRAESPATPPTDSRVSPDIKTEIKAEPPQLSNGAMKGVTTAELKRSPGGERDAAPAEPPERLPGSAAAHAAPPPIAVKPQDAHTRFLPEVHGSPVTPPEGLPPEAQDARQPFGRPPALTEPAEPPPAPPSVAPPPAPRSPPGSAVQRPPAAPPPPEPAPRPAQAAAPQARPPDGSGSGSGGAPGAPVAPTASHWTPPSPHYAGRSPSSQNPPPAGPAQQMISGGKLLLLVRVEGTLVDVAKPVSVDKWPAEQRQQLQLSVKTQHPNDTSLLQLPGSLLWVKLRPGIRTCLRQLSACFSMRLVSDLKPEVLTHIQHMLDPRGSLFEGSVVDSGSKVSGSKGKPVRHLDRERGVAGLLPLTLILDVKHQQFWQPSDSQYVLHCERYCYFPRSSTATTMPCLLAAGRDESAKGGVFSCACSALLLIHRRCLETLMSQPCSAAAGGNGAFLAWDAASVMRRERSRVLQGCVVQLASCAASLRERQIEYLQELARDFGARWGGKGAINAANSDDITHVIAISPDSPEAIWGIQNGRAVVKPSWLLCCSLSWRREAEMSFAVTEWE